MALSCGLPPEIANLRRACVAKRRLLQRLRRRGTSEGMEEARAGVAASRKTLRAAIGRQQKVCWRRILEEIEEYPWCRGTKLP